MLINYSTLTENVFQVFKTFPIWSDFQGLFYLVGNLAGRYFEKASKFSKKKLEQIAILVLKVYFSVFIVMSWWWDFGELQLSGTWQCNNLVLLSKIMLWKNKNKIEKSKKEKASNNCDIHLTFSNKQLRWDVVILTSD